MVASVQKVLRRQYVEYMHPNRVFVLNPKTSVEEIKDRDPKRALRALPEEAVGFRFFERTATVSEGRAVEGKPANYSGWYYVNARVLTLADVLREMSGEHAMIDNMIANKISKIVKTAGGNFYVLKEDDVILDASVKKVSRK